MPFTLGELLRTTRQERGISLEQVSASTRIRIHFLKALEDDEPEKIPSTVQGRGFLRLYADFLGLPVQPLLNAYGGSPVVLSDETEPQNKEIASSPTAAQAPEPEDLPSQDNLVQIVEPMAPETDGVDSEDSGVPQTPQPESAYRTILKKIGEELRSQREILHLSQADIERFTRLRIRYINALETGQLEDLPSPVQGRGMLSNYAEFLNLDEDALLLKFADALQARRAEVSAQKPPQASAPISTTPRPKPATPAVAWRRFLNPDLLIGVGIFAVFLIFIVWAVFRVSNLQEQTGEPTPPSISEVLMTTATPSLVPTELETNIPTQIQPTIDENIIVSEGDSTPESTLEIPVSTGPIQVYVAANQRTWMRVIVDGSVTFEGRVTPGNAYPFSGIEQIELLTGNGAALQVVYNETNLGVLGVTGEVIRLIFTRGGILEPTAMFTSTPTVTPQPSFTPQPSATAPAATITPLIR